MAYLGRMLGVDTPIIDGLINVASLINETDYWKKGWTLERMGSRDDIETTSRLLEQG